LSQSIRAVERALDVLSCFSRQTPELTMTQIAEQVELYKSTVHRLSATLEGKRFVQPDPVTDTYRLGIRLLQMAYLRLEHNDLRRLAVPFLSGQAKCARPRSPFSYPQQRGVGGRGLVLFFYKFHITSP
jgi:DNA-binding IclR family transcriptional regulator